MKVIVYTVNIGGYDELHESPRAKWQNIHDDVDYLYFTDGEAPDGWTKVTHETGTRKDSRYWKINSHLLPPHDISIYLDASYEFQKPITKILEDFNGDIGLCRHPHNSLIRHANNCIALSLDDPEVIQKQIGRYTLEGLPDIPLSENSLLVRRNNGIIKVLNETWWEEYSQGSQRDQLSLSYARWKANPVEYWFPFSARENKYLSNWCNHKKSRQWISNK